MTPDLHELLAQATGTATSVSARLLDERLEAADSARWGLEPLYGRFVELSARGATATLTTAIELLVEAQRSAEPIAWVALGNTTFYPPDVAASGVDLAALLVIRAIDAGRAARAAERLLRSGSFGLVVIDFGNSGTVELPVAHQGRLVKLAQAHHTAVICLTDKPTDAASLGSLVSLRAEATRGNGRAERYDVTLRVLKDKRRGPGWERTIQRRGPAGLRST